MPTEGIRIPAKSVLGTISLKLVGAAYQAAGFNVVDVKRTARRVVVEIRILHTFPKKGSRAFSAKILIGLEGPVLRYSGAPPAEHYQINTYGLREQSRVIDNSRAVWFELCGRVSAFSSAA